jgi:hypothetical protein
MGAHYRHTTPEMAARVVTAIQARLTVVVHAAEDTLEAEPTHLSRCVFRRLWTVFQANPWQMAVRSLRSMQEAGCWTRLGAGCGGASRRNRTGDPILTIRAAGYLQ